MEKPARETGSARFRPWPSGVASIVMAAMIVNDAYLLHKKGVLRRAAEAGTLAGGHGVVALAGTGRPCATP